MNHTYLVNHCRAYFDNIQLLEQQSIRVAGLFIYSASVSTF